MTAKRKRPKVRYVAHHLPSHPLPNWVVSTVIEPTFDVALCDEERDARRIAAALNLYEATKRREI